MPENFTCAIWCAVSTESQAAEDKASLEIQETKCRQLAAARGWVETSGPYIVPGASRTRYVNLRDAEAAIPPLHQLLDDAQAGRFQLLLLYDYNRLRDLADPVARTLAAYGVQLYSLNQPVEPVPLTSLPATDGESIMRGISQIISRWQINDLRRKYQFGVTNRARRGLYPLTLPYGYTTPAKDTPPTPEPAAAALLIELKDAYLNGAPLQHLTDIANRSGLKPRRGGHQWDRSIIAEILRNPFYAGLIAWPRTRLLLDPRTGRRHQAVNPQPELYPGKHPPLWDETTYRRILAETDRRAPAYRATHPFTGLLTCAACNAPVWVKPGGKKKDGTLTVTWSCTTPANPRHVRIPTAKVAALIASEIRAELQAIPLGQLSSLPSLPPPIDTAAIIASHRRRRARIEEAYESGLYELDQFKIKVGEIDTIIKALLDEETQERNRQEIAQQRQEILQTLGQFDHLDRWLIEDDPRTVNHALRLLCRTILLTPTSARLLYW